MKGFLSTGDEIVPGNYGLKDQVNNLDIIVQFSIIQIDSSYNFIIRVYYTLRFWRYNGFRKILISSLEMLQGFACLEKAEVELRSIICFCRRQRKGYFSVPFHKVRALLVYGLTNPIPEKRLQD